ncbi:MAG: NERD domain-containing protein [Clostridiales bacterium]|nr:NERD domain-containing protein [Clostridiales bacterium]
MAIAIVFIVIAAIIITVVCVVVGTKTQAPESKGERGENKVAQVLGNTIEGEQYVINDLLFENEPGQSCQIDHVFINKFGIWVIETKNYAGSIYGQEDQREWTQVLASGYVKNKLHNPVKQNASHIYHLSKYLKIKGIFHNIVVFLSRADISNVVSDNVYTLSELYLIKTQRTEVSLTVAQMEHYYQKLVELKNSSTISKGEHIDNIHRRQMQVQNGFCPRCGGKLVLREGKRGQFYGCSNYPDCRFIKDIDE